MKTKTKITTLVVAATFAFPMMASAEHMDVIEMEFVEGCSPAKFAPMVADFNKWAAQYGYKSKIAYPTFSGNLESFFWLGTSKDGATFGAAYDAWLAGVNDPKSTPAKINAKFESCTNIKARRSYFVN